MQDRLQTATVPTAYDPEKLKRFVNPEHIAVIGGDEAAAVIEQCRKLRFAGEISAIHPSRSAIAGVDCHTSVRALHSAPDAAFIAIPARPSIDVVEHLHKIGCAGVVCYASGFSETGKKGRRLQEQLVNAASDMTLLGPNCWGFINYTSGAALWPGYHGGHRVDRGVAIISQSGNIAINLSMHRRTLPIAWLFTIGNQAASSIEDYMLAALDSDHISAIGIYVEGLKNLPMITHAADIARQRAIPLVALKTGKSEIGARLTMSHPASLAGEDRLYQSLFSRLGIAETSDLETFLETLRFLSCSGPLDGNRIASVSCSGGEASLIADLVQETDLELPPLKSVHKQSVRETLNDYIEVDNPLDYHTFIWGNHTRMSACFKAFFAEDFDCVIQLIDFPPAGEPEFNVWQQAVLAFIYAVMATEKRAALISSLPESLPDVICKQLVDAGITPLYGMKQGLCALNAAYLTGEALRQQQALPEFSVSEEPADVRLLDEWHSKQILQQAGIAIPEGKRIDSCNDAIIAAAELGYPVVLKAVSSQLIHKTEQGAVAVSISDEKHLRERWQQMQQNCQDIAEYYLLEKMVQHAVIEMMVSIGWDKQFGHYLSLGLGGTRVELQSGHRLILLPVNQTMIEQTLQSPPFSTLLRGYRGQSSGDVDALIDCVLRIVDIVRESRDSILELEINPLLVLASYRGAVAADAVIRMRSS